MSIVLSLVKKIVFKTPQVSNYDKLLSSLSLDGEGADLEITVDDGKFLVHKSVMCRNSPILEKLFQIPHSNAIQAIQIKPLSYQILKVILEEFYTGIMADLCMFDLSAKKTYLLVLQLLGNKEFLNPCLNEMIEELTIENCVWLFHFTQMINLPNYEQRCLEYIGRYFPCVINTNLYQTLTYTELLRILSEVDIVAEPYQMYYGISNWLITGHDNWFLYARELLYTCNRVLRKREHYTPEFPWENSFSVSQSDEVDVLSWFGLIAHEYLIRESLVENSTDEGYSDGEY